MERPSTSITKSKALVQLPTTFVTIARGHRPFDCCCSVLVSPTFLPGDVNTGPLIQLNSSCSQGLVAPPFLPFEFNTPVYNTRTIVELVGLVELVRS